MFKSYDYKCSGCDKRVTLLVATEELESQVCTCGAELTRTLSVPHIRTAKCSVSYVDGQRKGSKAFKDLARQTSLEDSSMDATCPKEKAEITKELNQITKR